MNSISKFRNAFTETARVENSCMNAKLPDSGEFTRVVEELGGCTFEGGIYRVLTGAEVPGYTTAIRLVFPELGDRIHVFSYDWLGRFFAIDFGRTEDACPLVSLLEIGAGEVMQIPISIVDFHTEELVNYADDALARKFYYQWRELDTEELPRDQCVGYKIPLFLGGDDTLERTELSIYIEICGQLRNKIKTMSPGQTIRDINLKYRIENS